MAHSDDYDAIAGAMFHKQREAPQNAAIDDWHIATIVNTVVADTLLIVDGTLSVEDFQ